MKNGICPKCEAKDVHVVTNNMMEVAVPITWLRRAYINYYVCTNCGYVEIFVKNKYYLPKIAEKHPKV